MSSFTMINPPLFTQTQDGLGNFEMQDVMSRYNQAETLASSVQKKMDDTATGIIGKVG